MNKKFVEEVIRRQFPNYLGYAMNSKSIVVGIPKSDSMFFRESSEHPLLQQFTSFKRNGMSLHTEWKIETANEETDVMVFEYSEFQTTIPYLEALEVQELLEDSDDSDDPEWDIVFKSGKAVKVRGNNSREAIANALDKYPDEEVEEVDMIDENLALLKTLIKF